jgi:hypothetical protein
MILLQASVAHLHQPDNPLEDAERLANTFAVQIQRSVQII